MIVNDLVEMAKEIDKNNVITAFEYISASHMRIHLSENNAYLNVRYDPDYGELEIHYIEPVLARLDNE